MSVAFSFVALSSAVLAKVQSCTLLQQANIYDYEPFNPAGFSGYPAAVVVPSEERATFADTNRSEVHHFFEVRVHQEIPEQGAKNTEALLRQIADDLINRFNSDVQLGGQLVGLGYMRPIQVKWKTLRSPQVMEKICSITVEFITIQ